MNACQIEVTLRCNWDCVNCSRYCGRVQYYKSDLQDEHVDKIVYDIKSKNINVNQIRILGGEPTLHPNLKSIVIYLGKELKGHFNNILIRSNGSSGLKEVGGWPVLDCSDKSRYMCMMVAPRDTGQEIKVCRLPEICGPTYNIYGYWPCGPGGAIARLFGMEKYKLDDMPESPEEFGDISELCSLCQFSAVKPYMETDCGAKMSESFRKIFGE